MDLTVAARVLVGHCHFGEFSLPWYTEEWVECPWCGEEFSRDHMIWECSGLTEERSVLLRGVGSEHFGDLRWLAFHFGYRIGHFARVAGRLIESVDVIGECE